MSGTASFFQAMAPSLITNVSTVVFVYCFAVIGQQEGAEMRKGAHILWLIVMFMQGSTVGAFTRSTSGGARHPRTGT